MSTFTKFVRLTKVDPIRGIIEGTAAVEEVDRSGEIFDYASSKPNFQKWSGEIEKATDGKSVGNVRAQHGKVVAGKLTSIDFDDNEKAVKVVAKIVDKNELLKLSEGCYTGFSIGGKYEKKWEDEATKATRYTAVPSEVSIVDLPCIPGATFECVKDGGEIELRKFATIAPVDPAPAPVDPGALPSTEPVQVWKAADGLTFATKALAKAHTESLAARATEPSIAKLDEAIAKADAALKTRETVAPAAAAAPVEKRDFSDKEREEAADKGEAMPDGSFPIKSKTDLENAIKAFGRAKNKKAVKAHIKARAKALGAEDMLPDSWKGGADKAVRFDALRKDLYTVSRLACMIQDLEWLQQSTEVEAGIEGDASAVPGQLKSAIATLGGILRAMVEEETNELLDGDEATEYGELLEMSHRTRGLDALAKAIGDKSKHAGALAKVGARHSKADQEHLNAAHDHLQKMGVGDCAKAEYAAGDSLGKAGARHSKADMDRLTKAHDMMTEAGAECPGDGDDAAAGKSTETGTALESSEPEKMAKALESERAKSEELRKGLDKAIATIDGLADRIAKLEAQPMPDPRGAPSGTYRVVSKGEEDARAAREYLEDLSKRDPGAIALAAIALAQQNPGFVPTTR